MKKYLLLFCVAAIAAASLAVFAASDREVMAIGTKLDGFTMPDPEGNEHDYADLKGENGTLVVFLSAQCPVVKAYNDRINEIAAAYEDKGIRFVGVYSNHTESLEWVTEHSGENYEFTVLIDKNNVFADLLGASFTPEVYYFNADDVLDYHGAIDNDRSGTSITKTYLKSALDQKLDGKSISEQNTRAFGCSIKRIQDAK